MEPYRTDLAHIHDDGFGHLASGAAEVLITALQQTGPHSGTVVEVGCGSGITARRLTDAGYTVVGFDLSKALIEIARQRVPEATFHVGSFVGAELPSCVAVCAIGEVLSYAFDPHNNATARTALFARIHAALTEGGLFLFDMAGPDRASGSPTRTFMEQENWAVLAETSVDNSVLTRRITTFHRSGDLFRRDRETHRLLLVPPEQIETELRANGFDVERIDGYGETPLPPGLYGFAARRLPDSV